MTLHVTVAINPSASFGRGSSTGPEVVRALTAAGHDVVPLVASSWDLLVAAARRAVEARPDALVVVGGDGMVSLGTNLVAGTGVPLGIVPSGTGNDAARSLGIPLDDRAAAVGTLLTALVEGPRVVDAGLATTADGRRTWFAGTLSAGFDALVNERANRLRWPRGRRRYDVALALELLTLGRLRYELELDGEASATEGTLVSVGNGRSFGGGIEVLPHALVDDGLLDVLVVERLTRLQFLRLFPRVSRGEHLGDPRVHVRRVRRLRIDAPGVVAYADGERLGELPVEVECVPGALHVLAPRPVDGPGAAGRAGGARR